jgi:hypothetical protein
MDELAHRAEVIRKLMLATSEVTQLSEQIAKLVQHSEYNDGRIDSLAEAWISANLRARALREELARLDAGHSH